MAYGNSFASRWARLYAKPTGPELRLEPYVAALGLPYRFQHPVFAAHAILDFAVLAPTAPPWALEVDGASHRTVAGRVKDAERTQRLADLGWRVFRCENDEVLADPAAVVDRFLAESGIVPSCPRNTVSVPTSAPPPRPPTPTAPTTTGRRRSRGAR